MKSLALVAEEIPRGRKVGLIARSVRFTRRRSDYFNMSGIAEFALVFSFFALLIPLLVLDVLHHKFNSDEWQHLYVIWSWTRGAVQYRDIFDNHMPLFHLVFAPIAKLVGERATILYWMRFSLLPMFFVTCWCTYRIGTCLFDRRVGLWSVIALTIYGGSRLIEFRTDSFWVPFWLLCVMTLIEEKITMRRALVAGLFLGFCFAVSMKSVLMLITLGLSTPLAMVLVGRQKLGVSRSTLAQCAFAFLGMTALTPSVIMLFFWLKGLWSDFRYGVFDFNFLAKQVYQEGLLDQPHILPFVISSAIALAALILITRLIARTIGEADLAFERTLILLVCVFYYLLLNFWPPISRTHLPLPPLVSVLGVGVLLHFSDKLAAFRAVPLPVVTALMVVAFFYAQPLAWRDNTREETNLLRDILALTQPTDYVLDAKGETLFRPRCTQLVLERITMGAIARGLIADDSPRKCIETSTCVVATSLIGHFSPATRQFIERNYLPMTDSLRVAGVMLESSANHDSQYDFQTVIPAAYKIIAQDGNVTGTLDGQPYVAARFLLPGKHTFIQASGGGNLIALWAQAADRGFTPPLNCNPRSVVENRT